MKKKFTGIWTSFEYLDDFCNSVKELRSAGFNNLTTYSPCPRHEIDHALGDPQSRVPFFTLFFGIVGVVIAYTLASWMSLDWVLPVSGKPILSIPPFTVIGFELMVLFGAYGTMIGVVLSIFSDMIRLPFPKSKEFKEYPRFTRDRFGIVIRCKKDDFDKVQNILKKFQAEEVHCED